MMAAQLVRASTSAATASMIRADRGIRIKLQLAFPDGQPRVRFSKFQDSGCKSWLLQRRDKELLPGKDQVDVLDVVELRDGLNGNVVACGDLGQGIAGGHDIDP